MRRHGFPVPPGFPGTFLKVNDTFDYLLSVVRARILVKSEGVADIREQLRTCPFVLATPRLKDVEQGIGGFFQPVAADVSSKEEEGLAAVPLMGREGG